MTSSCLDSKMGMPIQVRPATKVQMNTTTTVRALRPLQEATGETRLTKKGEKGSIEDVSGPVHCQIWCERQKGEHT